MELQRVLRVADVPSHPPGGVNIALTEGAKEIRTRGLDVDLLFGDQLGKGSGGGRLRRFVTPWRVVLEVLLRQLRGRRYDLVELHEPLSGAYARARRLLRLPPFVVFSHGLEAAAWRAETDRWRRVGAPRSALVSRVSVPLTRLRPIAVGLRHADHLNVLNEGDRRFAVEEIGVPAERVTVVHNGVTAPFHEAELRPTGQQVRLLFLGSWIDRKGVRELVEATRLLSERGTEFELAVLGTRLPADELLSRFPESVRPRIVQHEDFHREELPELLAGFDILVMPSWFEGMPLTMLEAVAVGLACVATDLPAHREVFPAGEQDGAVLVPPHDARALADALQALIEDPARLRRCQASARSRGGQFTWSRSAEQHLEVWRRVAGDGRGAV